MKTNPSILLSFFAACALPASAATITWDAPQNITSESDVHNLGLVVTAVNGGSVDNAPPVTVGGVDFLWDDGNVLNGGSKYQYEFAPDPTVPDVSDNYDTLLSDARSFFTNIVISNLSTGKEYAVQIWVNDARDDNTATRQTTFTAGNISGYVQASQEDKKHSLGQYVIGNFTADAETQTITVEGYKGDGSQFNDARNVNALLVTTVPEPGSTALPGLLLCGAGFLRRRK